MVTPKVVAHFNSVDASSSLNQTKDTNIIRKGTRHFENFDIEAFQKLFDPALVWLYVFRTLLLAGYIYFYRFLERTAHSTSIVGKRFLNSTHKCNAHPCMHFVRRLPAQALARA